MAEAATGSVVKVRRTCFVKPVIPPQTPTMFLSNLDLFWLRTENVQTLYFYKLSPTIEYTSFIQSLKKSLSSILVYFYPLAGRLKKGESGRTEIDFTDGGVEFKEAFISVPFEHLENDGFRRKPFFQKLTTGVDQSVDENCSRPLLSIQVTAFKGSGICIGTIFNHVIADGNSFFHFMKTWAEYSRGLPISKPPQHNGRVFKRESKTSKSVSHKARDIVSVGIKGAKKSPKKHTVLRRMKNAKSLLRKGPIWYTPRFVSFQGRDDSRAETSFVAVAAHFWRCVMRARRVPRGKAVYFYVLSDCRGLVKPLLQPNYFGNCLSPGLAETRVEILLNSDISFAADVIQKLISSCTEKSQINHMIDWVESSNTNFIKQAAFEYRTGALSSPRFPLYETDYGWGKPGKVQIADYSDIGSMVLLPPNDGGKSMLVSTCLPQHQMEFLQHLFSERFNPLSNL